MSHSKRGLVDYCIMLEKNNEVLRDTLETQYANCMKMIDDMKILNRALETARSTSYEKTKEGILEEGGPE